VPVLVDAFGCRWTLEVRGDDDLSGLIEHLWERARVREPVGPAEGADAEPFTLQRREDGALEIGASVHRAVDDDIPYAVSRALTLASIRRRTGECLMLHAAGLATPDGSTVALVAASGTGKTTASRTLGRRLGYVSDETVAVEHDLEVRAYPKPLSVVTDPRRPTTKHERSPDDLGLACAPDRLHLAATVVIERDPDLDAPVLEPVGLVDAAALVLPQTSAVARLDRPLDRLARVLTAGHGPWRLRYAEIADCADLVGELAAGLAPGGDVEEVTWDWVDGRDRPDPGPSTVDTPERWTVVERAAFDDAVVSDGSVLVMRDRVPTTLPGLAATVWLLLDRPAAVEDLVAGATGELGRHPDAEELVLDTVGMLHDAGLVVLR
jgi:hypothetical protein